MKAPMATTTIFKPSLLPLPAAAVHYVCQSWWTCHTGIGGKHYYRERLDSLLSLGEGLSVIPPAVLERLDLFIETAKGLERPGSTSTRSPCRGRGGELLGRHL